MISHSSVKFRQVSSILAWNLFSSAYVKMLNPDKQLLIFVLPGTFNFWIEPMLNVYTVGES